MIPGVPTPLYSHAGRGDFRDVYEPAEDSFLLMDALEQDAQPLRVPGGGIGLWSGVSSGMEDLTVSCASRCTDVNPAAARCTAETASRNRVPLQSAGRASRAWAGGLRGREVTDRLLPLVGRLLSAAGLFYLVTIAENRPDDIQILGQQGLTGEPCLTTRAGNERLSILRFHRSPENTT
uniref:N-6 adenine-specific DNA methyltransferase 1 n=1 Tax=Salarias fasciatus TaxID=181472 RepID=A0A672FUT4_SALFA